MVNAFSKTWCELFLTHVPSEHTELEVEFIRRHLPLPDYEHLLDVACGTGRHSHALADAGYRVLGVDRSSELVEAAERAGERARFRVLDMLDLGELEESFDGVLNLWHSFGFHDAATDRALLERFRDKLRPRGRLVLDLYNRDHAIARPHLEQTCRAGVTIETRRSWAGPRLLLELYYDGILGDRFDWHLYSPDELRAACEQSGFEVVLRCAWFDAAVPVSPEHARMQFVLERR
jgi:SAM-dependent methyltransferase